MPTTACAVLPCSRPPPPSSSSAPAINCLMAFFGVGPQHIPLEQRPALVLSAESELGITAGLQDRVIQVGRGGWGQWQ